MLSAEEIQLKDGSKITGKITGVDGNTFQVKTAYGEIKVPRTEIVTIQFPENSTKKSDAAGDSSPFLNHSMARFIQIAPRTFRSRSPRAGCSPLSCGRKM